LPHGKVEHSLDSIISPEFKIFQPIKGYRVNIDTLILYDFALKYAKGDVLEIGSSTGVISILLSKSSAVRKVIGVEIDQQSHKLAIKNAEINECKNKVEFINGDINDFKKLFNPQSFDTIVTNPPFIKHGTGRLSDKHGLNIAHQDSHLTIDLIFRSARYLLRPKGFLIVLFTTHRLEELFLNKAGFSIELIRFIHRRSNKPADAFLFLAKKGGGRQIHILPPLFVHEGKGYTQEIAHIHMPQNV